MTTKPNPGKDALGHFNKGNRYAAVNRDKHHAEWDKAVKSSDIKRIIKKLISMAEEGNIKAITYFLDRVLGRVKESVEITSPQLQVSPEELRTELFNRIKELEHKN